MHSKQKDPAPMPSHPRAIAFDFDGTLIQNGPLNVDKGVHIIFSAWYACRRTALAELVDDGSEECIERAVQAFIRYPGSPRFEQFSAIVNAFANDTYNSVPDFDALGLDETVRDAYEQARQWYNTVYSALNDAAAEHFWKPYPSVKNVLSQLANHYDLLIASGVTEDILREDFDRHSFDRSLFQGIYGGDESGGNDKGQILTAIKNRGYDDVLFVADSNKDLEYATIAAVKFFRIHSDADYRRLAECLPGEFPDQRESWDFEDVELDFFRAKSAHLIRTYQDTEDLPFVAMSHFINS